MILPTHRAFTLTFAILWGLLLTLGLLTTLPAQAQEGPSVASRDLVPLPGNCSGLVPGDQTPVCCAAGYVLVDGEPVAGAEVEISSAEGTLVVSTSSDGEISEPYYAATLSDTLSVVPGEWVTFTVSYDGFTVVRAHQAITGSQQVDLVINTFEGGRFEGTDLVSDTIQLFHSPTANVRVNDDDESNDFEQIHPSLAADASGNVYAVWADPRNDGFHRIYFSHSADSGENFTANIPLQNDSGMLTQYIPTLVTDGNGSLYVAWTELDFSTFPIITIDIYFAKSLDGGATWSSAVQIEASQATLWRLVWPWIAVAIFMSLGWHATTFSISIWPNRLMVAPLGATRFR